MRDLKVRSALAVVGLSLSMAGCKLGIPIPEGELDEIASMVCKVGHPAGRYVSSEVIDFSTGWFSQPRSIDVAITYDPVLGGSQKVMTVRFVVTQLDPCEVQTKVVSDTGLPPVLLDNSVASPLVGNKVCDAFAQ